MLITEDARRSTPRKGGHAAYVLVGPTAVGKTLIAQRIAERNGYGILSADSMHVYRGMDIGTAKPSPQERGGVAYRGMDLVDPSATFSVGAYVGEMKRLFEGSAEGDRQWVVVGGTGLYVKALLQGLDELPAADPTVRRRAEALLKDRGVEALQTWLKELDQQRYDRLPDRMNPRRLTRQIELATHGAPMAERPWAGSSGSVVGLRMEMSRLRERIRARVVSMYENGLLDEARRIRLTFHELSPTALQAIGYREAFAVLDGAMSRDDAVEQTVERTHRLAKRQMTWFRHQADVEWVDVTADADDEAIEHAVRGKWEMYGPARMVI